MKILFCIIAILLMAGETPIMERRFGTIDLNPEWTKIIIIYYGQPFNPSRVIGPFHVLTTGCTGGYSYYALQAFLTKKNLQRNEQSAGLNVNSPG
jgi:hypothetical protein